jgi:hypothetical protein
MFGCALGSDPLDLLELSVAKRYCDTFGNGDTSFVSLSELSGVEFSSLSGVSSQAAGPKASGELAAIAQLWANN